MCLVHVNALSQSKASVLCQHLFQEQLTDVLSGTGGCLAQQPELCVCPEPHVDDVFSCFSMIVHWNMIMYRQMSFCAWWLIVLWGQMYILGCFKQELLEDNQRSYWVY